MDISSEEFDFSQWLADCLNTDLSKDVNFDSFASNIFSSINQFARLNKEILMEYFSQLNKETINRLRSSLAYEVLDFHNLEATHSLKKTTNHKQILEDLYIIIQLASATEEQIKKYNLSSTFDITNNDILNLVDIKNFNQLYELLNDTLKKNHNLVVEKLKNSEKMVKSQNKKIDSLQDQNNSLMKEIEKLKAAMDKVDTTLRSKNNWPPIPTFNATNVPSFSSIGAGKKTSNINNN